MGQTPEQRRALNEGTMELMDLQYHQDIRLHKTVASGPCEITPDVNFEAGYCYQVLVCDGRDAAINDPEHAARAHRYFLPAAKGRVLISGLGLGDSLDLILQKPEVEFVRVVEFSQDIIDLVSPAFAPEIESGRVEIIQGDVFTYTPDQPFDCVYHAIWTDEAETREAVDQRAELRERYAPYCKWQGFMFLSNRGGTRKGGRKPGTTGPYKPREIKRSVRKGLRYTPREYELIEEAAGKSGLKASEIAQTGAVKEAIRIITGQDDKEMEKMVKRLIGV